jgi:hypothetical protein
MSIKPYWKRIQSISSDLLGTVKSANEMVERRADHRPLRLLEGSLRNSPPRIDGDSTKKPTPRCAVLGRPVPAPM